MLKVDNVVARHGLLTAVRNVSLTVAKGQVLAIIGANGAGKTTVFSVVAGSLLPSSGTVQFSGFYVT